jgi:hypothetical protein
VPLERLACYDRLNAATQPARPIAARPAPARLELAAPVAPTLPAYTKAPVLPTPSDRWYGEVEQTFNWFSRGHAGPLIVTGSAPVTGPVLTQNPIPTSPGFIGLRTLTSSIGSLSSNNTAVFGAGGLDTQLHIGENLRFGYWLDPEHNQAIEGGAFYMGRGTEGYNPTQASPNGIGIPFIAADGSNTAYMVNRPTTTAVTSVYVNTTPAVFVHLFDQYTTLQATGTASANYTNSIWGTDLNYRLHTPFLRERGLSLDLTAGVKYVNLNESLVIGSAVSSSQTVYTLYDPALGLPGSPNFVNATGATTTTSDTIKTRNNFIGPQFGMRGDYRLDDQWSVSGDVKLALGANVESLSVSGSTNSTVVSTTTPTSGISLAGIPLQVASGTPVVTTTTSTAGSGIFASPANSGVHNRTVFAALPSGNFKLNYDLLPNFLTLSLGYNVFWISDVLRASNQLVGVNNAPTYAQSSIVAQGVTVGAKVKF